MDSPVVVAISGVVVGWLARDWTIPSPSKPDCNCHCSFSPAVPSVEGHSIGPWALLAICVVGAILVFSNTALALKVSLKDNFSGQNREIHFNVKGKSKGSLGIYGGSKGLQITH